MARSGAKSLRRKPRIKRAQTEDVAEDDDAGEHKDTRLRLMLKDWPFRETNMLTSWRDEASNEELKSYRASLRRACAVSTNISQGPTATLLWRKEWGRFSKFTQNDHEISISASIFSGLHRFQPVSKEDAAKLVASLFGRDRIVFLPVQSSFVSLLHLREGVKFVVRDPNPELTALLDDNDYVLFAGGFDVTTASCEAGILFKESGLVLGVILRDAYSYFMADLSLELFGDKCDRAITLPIAKKEDICQLNFLFMVSQVLWFRSPRQKIWPKTRRVVFCYEALNQLHNFTTLKWSTHVITDCPMKIVFRYFAENLGESESALAFQLGNDKTSFDGNVAVGSGTKRLTFRAHLKDPKKPGGLGSYIFLGEEKEVELRLLRMSRLAVIHRWAHDPSDPQGPWSQGETKFLVEQDFSIARLVRFLDNATGRSAGKNSYLRFCYLNDGSLFRVPVAMAGNPGEMADYAGIDPVQMVLVLKPRYSLDKIKTVPHFGRAPIDGNVFRLCEHALVWKGDVAFAEVSTTTTCSAWISMSTAISPAEQEAIRDRCELWPESIKLVSAADLSNGPSVLNDDNSFELHVTFCPVWYREDVVHHADDILVKLQDHRVERAFFPFLYRDGESYGMLHFDQESGSFKMRLAKPNADGFDKLLGRLDSGVTLTGSNALAREKVSVLGVMTFKLPSAHFAVVYAKEYFDVDGLFEATYSSGQPSHIWLKLEEAGFAKAARKRNLVDEAVLAVNAAGPIANDQPYLVVTGTAEEVNRIMKERDYKRLARVMMLAKKRPQDESVHMIRMTKDAREWFAKLICEGSSASVAASLKDLLWRETSVDIKKPALVKTWARSLERAETFAIAASSSALSTGAKPKARKKILEGLQKDAEALPVGSSLAKKGDRKKFLAAAAKTDLSKEEAFAKLEVLHQRLFDRVMTPEKSAEVDSIMAETRSAAHAEVAASGPSLKQCTFCRIRAFEMKVCGRCKVTHYCTQKCQTVDWKRHKADCRENHKSRMDDLVKLL